MGRSWSARGEPHRVLKLDARRDWQRGEDVRRLQSAVNRRLSARGRHRYLVSVDGEYGPATALACRRSLYLLGAMLATVKRVTQTPESRLSIGGQRMIRFPGRRVRGHLERARDRRELLARRAKQASSGAAVRRDAVEFLTSRVGRVEWDNRAPWLDEWQRASGTPIGSPWCGVAIWAAYRHAGHRVDGRVRSVRWIYDSARQDINGLSEVPLEDARPGDLAILFGPSTHVGMVRAPYTGGNLKTCEGNTSPPSSNGSQDNGGGIWERERSPSDVVAVVRVHI